jgi:hypothetical protein
VHFSGSAGTSTVAMARHLETVGGCGRTCPRSLGVQAGAMCQRYYGYAWVHIAPTLLALCVHSLCAHPVRRFGFTLPAESFGSGANVRKCDKPEGVVDPAAPRCSCSSLSALRYYSCTLCSTHATPPARCQLCVYLRTPRKLPPENPS